MITTLIPAYKTEYLKDTLLCLCSQTYKDFEVILSDDRNDSNIIKFIEENKSIVSKLNLKYLSGPKLGKNHLNIKHLIQNRNKSRNLVHLLFDDDLIYPGFYEQHVLAHSQTQAGLTVSNRWMTNEQGLPVKAPKIDNSIKSINTKFNLIERNDLIKLIIPECNNWLGEYSNTVFKSHHVEYLITLRTDDISVYGLGDVAAFLFADEKIVWINEFLGGFRRSSNQITGNLQNPSNKASYLAWVTLAIICKNKGSITNQLFDRCLSKMAHAIKRDFSEDREMLIFNELIIETIQTRSHEKFLAKWESFIIGNGFN